MRTFQYSFDFLTSFVRKEQKFLPAPRTGEQISNKKPRD